MPSGTTPIWRLTSTGCGVEIEAENFDAPGGGREQAGEHLDGGGFARAVGAEEAEELSGRDAQVDAVNGHKFAEAAAQALGGDGGCAGPWRLRI